MSSSGIDSVTSLNAGGVQTQSANGGIPVSSLSGGVSTMSSSYGGITCYKAACDSGYYLDAPYPSYYFSSTSKSGTLNLTCYKVNGCASGYYSGGSGASYHGTTCTQCSYVCPTNYYAKGSTWTDYKLTSTCTPKICNGDSSQKLSSNDCCTRTSKTCTDYSSSYKSSQPSGQNCTKVTPRSGLTCYKDCKDSNYTLTHKMTLSMIYIRWSITDSSGKEIGSGSKLANNGSVEINDTYTVPAGEYTVQYEAIGWVPCDQYGNPKNYCACEDRSGSAGSPITTKTFTVSGNTTVPYVQPYCGRDGCSTYPCTGGSGGIGIQPSQ